MGLFNSLIRKATREATKSIINDAIQNSFNGNNQNNNSTQSYDIPEKYNMFPRYNGNMLQRPVERETYQYSRVTMRYSGSPSSEFISALTQNGFTQSTSVRYDKSNTYVIVDNLGGKTEIVYHIKK